MTTNQSAIKKFSWAILVSLAFMTSATAQVPEGISYQSYLTDSAGQAIDQSVNVQFALYTVETGGVPLWSETLVLLAESGLVEATLGVGLVPFPIDLFATPLWLGVTVGNDAEMTPRRALTAAPYATHAQDADTLQGVPAFALDQSGDVATLSATLSNTNTNINALSVDVAGHTASIVSLDGQVVTNTQDINQLNTTLTTTNADLAAVETTLPTLQPLVSSSCAGGSSIRQIFSNGNVTCELDDTSPWGLFNNNLYYIAGSIGVGTSAPAAAIQIDAPLGVDPFRARVQSSTKLRVHMNGSVSVGSSSAGPDDGLYVLGDARFGGGSSTARMTITDNLWHAAIDNNGPGGNDWFIGSSATAWAAGGGKFIISPTDSSTNAALLIDSNKDVGIGVIDPLTRLHLGGGSDVSASGGGYLTIGGITGANIALDSNEIMARSNGNVAPLALNAEGGEVSVNIGGSRDHDSLEVRGRVFFDNGGNSGMRITATNSSPTNAVLEPTVYEAALVGSSLFPFWRVYSREFYAESPLQYKTYSDRSLKQNIRPIPDALDTISALQGVTYELSSHPMDNRNRTLTQEQEYDRLHQLGFIAQDVEKVVPQMVSLDESSGLMSVGYLGVVPILVEAMKEQQALIEAQQAQLDAQQRQIDVLMRK